MPPSGNSKQAKIGAGVALAALVAASLTLTQDPPADPLLGSLGALLRQALLTPLQSLFLLGLFGGFLLLTGVLVLALRAYLGGGRLDWLAYLVRRLWQMALACCVLGLLALSIQHARPPVGPETLSPGRVEPAPPRPPQPLPARELNPQPRKLDPLPPLLLAAGALLAAAALLGFALRTRAGMTTAGPVAEEPAPFAAARRRLQLGDQARDAIIDCYAEMCAVFAKRSPAQARSLTAREFAAHLRDRGAGEPEILALTAVFERARYSTDPCDERDRALAAEALQAIEDRYGAPGRSAP